MFWDCDCLCFVGREDYREVRGRGERRRGEDGGEEEGIVGFSSCFLSIFNYAMMLLLLGFYLS